MIAGGRQIQKEQGVGGPSKIVREGERRLRIAGIERYEARERIAGFAMPMSLKHYKVQIEYAIAVLSQLDPIPPDYMSDGYWPSYENAGRRLEPVTESMVE